MTAGWVGQTAAEALGGPRSWTLHSLFDSVANLILEPSGALVHVSVERDGIRAPFGIEVPEAAWRRWRHALAAGAASADHSARPGVDRAGDGTRMPRGSWDPVRGVFRSGRSTLELGSAWRDAIGESSVTASGIHASIGISPQAAVMISGIATVAPAERVLHRARMLLDALLAGDNGGGGSDALTTAASWLIGRGPGLTPSGDDIVIGILGAVHRAGLPGRSAAGVLALESRQADMGTATTEVSRAYLRAACRGRFAAPIRRVLLALGDPAPGAAAEVRSAVGALRSIGHTSGADTLVGLVVATERLQVPEGAARPRTKVQEARTA